MFILRAYNILEAKYLKLEAKHNAKKIECEEIKKELEEAKKNEKHQINYVNQLKKEKDETTVEYNKMCDDCFDLLGWNEASDKENKEQEKTNDELKKAVFALKEILGKEYSDWNEGPGMAWRISKITGKTERYDIPRNFDESDADELYFDENLTNCKFKYPNRSGYLVDYPMPISLYTFIGGKAFVSNHGADFSPGVFEVLGQAFGIITGHVV